MMQNDIRLGKVFGIEIFISYSWFFIYALVTVTLAFGFFPGTFPRHAPTINALIGIFASAVFFASLLFHELCHSFVANMNGIPIKKITLFIFGGMSQMSDEPREPAAEFKMAAAGPLASFLLAALFFAIFRLMIAGGLSSEFYAAFSWLAQINFFLAVFNLAPGFPLDGGRVLRAAIWYFTGNVETATKVASKAGQGVGLALITLGVVFFLFGQIGGIWLVLIGWFLNQSAIAAYRQVAIEQSLARIDVGVIMSPNVEIVDPNVSLEELINHYFLKYRYGRFPVVDDGALLGIVTLHDVKEVPRDRWPTVTAGEIIEPLEEDMFVTADSPAMNALFKMANDDVGHLLVVDEARRLVGIITRTDIIRLVKMKSELEL